MELFKNFKDLWRGVALALVISVPAWLLGKQFEVIGGPVFAILIGMALGLVLRHRLALVISVPAWLLGKQFEVIGGPVFAILIGMALGLVLRHRADVVEATSAGIKYTSKKILQYAVILLGFGLNLGEIAKVGASSLPIIISTITTSLVISFVLCRALHIPKKISTLVGVGSSICGGSAIAATAPVIDADDEEIAQAISVIFLFNIIPKKISTLVGVGSSICGGSAIAATAPVIDADDEEIAQAISVIFLFNIIAALIFPSLGAMLGMSNEGFGLFAGTAVNDTSSVTAAAAAWDGMHPGSNALDHATIVKLTRTLAIIPITLFLAFWQVRQAKRAAEAGEGAGHPGSNALDHATIVKLTRTLAIIPITLFLAFWQVRQAKRAAEAGEGAGAAAGTFDIKKIFPFFILFFVLASVITTVFALPVAVTAPIKTLSKFFIVAVTAPIKTLSKFFIVMAMAAIGFNTDIVKLVKTGGKPIFMGLCCWIGIACVSLGMQSVLGIW